MTSTTMELVPLLSLCVLTWSGSTSADVQGPEIKVKEGSDVTLPCNIAGNIESKRFMWKKDNQTEVYLYDAGLSSSKDLSGQSDQFKGRVSHFPEKLKNGDASIKIRKTKVADSGNYTCEFKHLPNQKFLTKLLVGAISSPIFKTDKTDKGMKLECEVQGATFKPTVQWQDGAGNNLKCEKPPVPESGGSYNVTLHIIVTKSDYYRCVATQEEISHQVSTRNYVTVPGEKSAGTREIAAWAVVVLAVVVLVLVGLCVCYRRSKRYG
ncbi:butyrophilin-like protein 10 isoform X3 [Seriola aureovittata]|uniref:butyrophilin-like protein 10 isoform X3 n=1 Tax=Seriola aureovittata TaxID=2871759 RepID=UPI0024BDD386|nr:butyrophilin-like protein 10 isoform X3 [Seriola aureovittata]